jgi:hypothetical protein
VSVAEARQADQARSPEHAGEPQRSLPLERRRARRRPRETAEVAQTVERFLRALGRRVADGDPDQLRHFTQIREVLAEAEGVAVAGLRAQGHSDTFIGEESGISRQLLAYRHGRGGDADRT